MIVSYLVIFQRWPKCKEQSIGDESFNIREQVTWKQNGNILGVTKKSEINKDYVFKKNNASGEDSRKNQRDVTES